ncbi:MULTISPECIES: hypothetical protein [unclassified Streptomyces]|uniref:hypothetical protein n=1 Tax=unclassified Streptomyces TaxID=2593676 RepID=UPI0001B543B0|nr:MULTISPECIES: hypothetical protein [unclassified Streptomyces]SCE95271.1 hypothetical protein GA0115257_104916 [Streptomyces sp. LcepLS]
MTGDADSAFLTHASEVAFDLGEDRFRLTTLRIRPRRVEFTEVDGPALPPVYREGPPPGTGRAARRTYDWWQPGC